MKPPPSLLRFLGLLALMTGLVRAQSVPEAVVTTGTSAVDGTGRPWIYVHWQTGTDVSEDRMFSVHTKAGPPDGPGVFVLREAVAPATVPSLLAVHLSRAANLGRPPEPWAAAVDVLAERLEAPPGLDLPGKFSALMSARSRDRRLADLLRMMSTREPALAMALGRGWAGLAEVPEGSPVTVELRDWDPVRKVAGGVVGRLVVTAGRPAPLPAPGMPVQVPDHAATGDRTVLLRWATPESLRGSAARYTGVILWRVDAAEAESRNWHREPPTAEALDALSRNSPGLAARVTPEPLNPTRLLDANEVADFRPGPADLDRFHYVGDDNGARNPATAGGVPRPFFEDGARFYYFGAAADLLGRPGIVSPGGLGVARWTLSPSTPVLEVGVEQGYLDPGLPVTAPRRPVFRLRWTANPDSGNDLTTHYEVFRAVPGPDGAVDLAQFQDPVRRNALRPLAVVPHAAGGAEVRFLDTNTTPTADFVGRSFAFVLRAVRERPWGRVVSAFGPPVTASIRDLTTFPAVPTGGPLPVLSNCPRVSVLPDGTVDEAVDPGDSGGGRSHYRVLCTRGDAGVLWAEFRVLVQGQETARERVFFPADDLALPAEIRFVADSVPQVFCVVGSEAGATSPLPGATLNGVVPGAGRRTVLRFTARALDDASLAANPVFAAPLLGQAILPVTALLVPEAGLVEGTLDAADGTYLVSRLGSTGGHGRVQGGRILFFDPAAVPGAPVPPGYNARVVSQSLLPGAGDCPQVLEDPTGSGQLRPVVLRFRLTPGTHQYRIWRSVDSGTLELVGQAPERFQPTDPNREVVYRDIALPPDAALVEYFAQLSGRDGQDGPMIPIGKVVPARPLPAPLLATPKSTTTADGQPAMRLTWTCPPRGVARFEIVMKAESLPVDPSIRPSWVGSVGLYNLAGAGGTASPARSTFQQVNRAAAQLMDLFQFDDRERALTGFVGSELVEDPPDSGRFTFELRVQRGVRYGGITVRALGFPAGSSGPPGNAQSFVWTPPLREEQVAWPARPLPPANRFHPDVRARLLGYRLTPRLLVPVPVPGQVPEEFAQVRRAGVLIGRSGVRGSTSFEVVGDGPDRGLLRLKGLVGRTPTSGIDPNTMTLRRADRPSDDLLPVALYRQVVATGEIQQVSPLLERIAWNSVPVPGSFLPDGILRDPYVAVADAMSGTSGQLEFYLLDTQPAVAGETYRYLLLRFDAVTGEMTETIPAGELTFPEEAP
jgi:hypothetical protein